MAILESRGQKQNQWMMATGKPVLALWSTEVSTAITGQQWKGLPCNYNTCPWKYANRPVQEAKEHSCMENWIR